MEVTGKIYGLIFAACMDFVMAFVMSFFMTWINIGFIPNFLVIWLKSFGLSFVVAYPFAAGVVPPIRALLDKFIEVKDK